MDASPTPVIAACASVPGGRSENQDRCYVTALDPTRSLWGFRGTMVVADGMGGHEKGEVAAQLAIDTAGEILGAVPEDHEKFDPGFLGAEPEDVIRRVFDLANERVYERAREDELRGNMGTTMTALVVTEDEVVVGHVGDSKAFVVSGEGIEQITEDHSWVAEQVKEGRMTPEEAAGSPLRGHLTQAIGVETEVAPYTRRLATEPGAMLVVCSDGLTEVLNRDAIRSVAAVEESPEQVCQTLVSMAVDGGTRDNVTVAAMALGPAPGDAGRAPGPDPIAAGTVLESAPPADGEEASHAADDAGEPVPPPLTPDGEGERAVEGQRSRRLAILAATCMFSLVAGLAVGRLLIGSRTAGAPETGATTTVARPAQPPQDLGQPDGSPAQPPETSEASGPPQAAGGGFKVEVRCEGDLLIISANERVTYDVYPRGRNADYDARLIRLEGGPSAEARFRLPEPPPDSWHQASIALTVERLGDQRITIVPQPQDLEVFVDYEAHSGGALEALAVAGRHARIGFYFPPSQPENAYAVAIADFDTEPDEPGEAD